MVTKQKVVRPFFPFVALLLALSLMVVGCGGTPTPKPQSSFALDVSPGTQVQVGKSVAIVATVKPLEKLDLKWSASGTSEGILNVTTGEQVIYTAGQKEGVDIVIAEGTTASGVTVKQTVIITVVLPPVTPTNTVTPSPTPSPTVTPTPSPSPTPPGFLFNFEGGTQGWMPGTGSGWKPDERALSVTVTNTSTYVSEGKWSLQCEFNGEGTTGDYKATCYSANLPIRDWRRFSSLKFDVYNSLDANTSLEVTIALATGSKSCWNESTMWTSLAREWNRGVSFRLDTRPEDMVYKRDLRNCPTQQEYGEILLRENVQRLHLVFLLTRPMRGTIFIDNVRLE